MHIYHKKKLRKLLSQFEDEDLFQLIWSANIVQSGKPSDALRFLDPGSIHNEAIGAEGPDKYSIQKWELETLVNEGLTTPVEPAKRGEIRRLRPDHFSNVGLLVNRLRKLENKEFNIGGHKNNIFGEIARIASRQFPWQVGSDNMANLYRNNYIYGQGKCGEAFVANYGVDVSNFTKVAFGLFAHFTSNPVMTGFQALRPIGISDELFQAAIKPLCADLAHVKAQATRDRKKVIHTAYKPSVFRQFPCVNFAPNSSRIRSPLPQLIMDRMTTGLFYDVLSGGGAVRAEYGKRFESYCIEYCKASLPDLTWEPEKPYKVKKQPFKTSDVLCFDKGQLILAIECKATRMSLEAMYGKDPTMDRGFKELINGVKQVWRFFAHCRLSHCDIPIGPNAVGMVLTLDNWLVAAGKLQNVILETAEKELATSGALVTAQDRKNIIFTPVAQLERALSRATKTSFCDLLIEASNPKYKEWNRDVVHENLPSFDPKINRGYPFKDKVDEVLPWWGAFGEEQ